MSALLAPKQLDRRAPSAADFSKNHVNTPNGQLSKAISAIPAVMALEKISVTCGIHGKATWFITSSDLAAGKTGCQKCRWEFEAIEQKQATERQAMLSRLNMPVEHIGADFHSCRRLVAVTSSLQRVSIIFCSLAKTTPLLIAVAMPIFY